MQEKIILLRIFSYLTEREIERDVVPARVVAESHLLHSPQRALRNIFICTVRVCADRPAACECYEVLDLAGPMPQARSPRELPRRCARTSDYAFCAWDGLYVVLIRDLYGLNPVRWPGRRTRDVRALCCCCAFIWDCLCQLLYALNARVH